MSVRLTAWWGVLAAAWLWPGCRPRPALEPPAAPAAVEEEVVEPATPVPPPAEPALNAVADELKVKKSGQVSVLCYHDFTTGKSNNPMVINIQHFRAHMQALKDARLEVISMERYLAWRRGEKDIPDPAVLLTFDDGWKSVHALALPVLKEFGYPFTIFLYKNYVNGGGRALTTAEIRELMANGATVGSHSVSHPYPPEFRRRAKGPPAEYEAWLETEFKVSKEFLESLLGVEVRTFAYPGGFYSPEMARKGREVWGYEALFTCNAVRTDWDTPLAEIGRFVIYGNDEEDRNFRAGTNFSGGVEDLGRQLLGGQIGEDGTPQAPMVVVKPGENETVVERRPLIEVDLSRLTDIDPESVVMRIPGLGQVPATFSPDTGRLIYRPVQVLRSPDVTVHVRLRRRTLDKDDVVSWKFFIDQKAHYLPKEPVAPLPPAGQAGG
jgi:peptidoglycan/xylan/chitin deacetylase (PgdA/CDA1 family)